MLPAARESRRQLLSHLRTEVGREALEGCNALVLTPLGEVVEQTWMKMLGLGASVDRPISVELEDGGVPRWLREKAQQHDNEGALIRSLSKRQRQEYYALVGRNQQPLFDDNYDDTVCLDECHRRHPVTGQPYEETADYANDRRRWEAAILEGCTVIVTLGSRHDGRCERCAIRQ